MFVAERGIRPNVLWYFVAVLLLLAGLVTAGVLVFQSFRGIVERTSSMRLFSAPGQVGVRFDKPGAYMIYEVGGAGASATAERLTFTVIEQDTNKEIFHHLAEPMGNLTINNDPYEPLRAFSLDRPGTLTVRAEPAGPLGAGGLETRLAVGPRVGFQDIFTLIIKIFVGMGAGVVGIAAGVAIFVVTLLKRTNVKQRLGQQVSPKLPAGGFASPPAPRQPVE